MKALAAALVFAAGCSAGRGALRSGAPCPVKSHRGTLDVPPEELEGVASWYGAQHQGKLTAGGLPFDMRELSAAHRTLRLGTRVRVTNLDNGRWVEVCINDRGPFARDRVLDLSRAAAEELGFLERGTCRVRIEVPR